MRVALLVMVMACSHPAPVTTIARVPPLDEQVLALLPEGAQVIVEIDLARLRANAAVGETAKAALASLGADSHLPGLPVSVFGSPLATADHIVLAAYGVGTANAVTITLLSTKSDVPNGQRVTPDIVALGPEDSLGQLQTRAALGAEHPLAVSPAILKLRDHSMLKGATGAVVRVTARLGFDARIALARVTGLEAAPAQLSMWLDVSDDMVMVIDADSSDPTDVNNTKAKKSSARELAHVVRGLLTTLAETDLVRGLGVPTSLSEARLITEGTWVRAIVAVGPRHLARVAERARAMLAP